MICTISGEAPEDPMISNKSRLLFVFERQSNPDLQAVKPRPLQAASIPWLPGMFQNGSPRLFDVDEAAWSSLPPSMKDSGLPCFTI